MEKRTPAYDLASIQEEFSSVETLRMSKTARDCIVSLEMTREDVVHVVRCLTRKDFYKSMTSYADYRVWQDVYHAPWGDSVLYIKFTVDAQGHIILSCKEA